MNLNLNSDQFLLVYNFVTSNVTSEAKELKAKMDLIIHEALSKLEESKNQSKFPQWLKKEQEKIFMLSDELKSMKSTAKSCSEKTEPDDGLYFRKA